MFSANFIEGLNAYAEYTYVSHKKDTLEIINSDLKQLFEQDIDMNSALEADMQESAWSSQDLHCGIGYRLTENIEIGASFKAHIAGESVPRIKGATVTTQILFWYN